ncbi:hypothetical protein [Sphingomonas sp.]|uniref:hypothetical protein n=1 Tax=Sphingomonas sp. TaxID=28214 RepID=UPI003AFF91D7
MLLLDARARPEPGALAEIAAVVGLDPLAGFAQFARDAAGAGRPPRMAYTARAAPGCLLVRRLMLAEFGLLDEAFAGLDAA